MSANRSYNTFDGRTPNENSFCIRKIDERPRSEGKGQSDKGLPLGLNRELRGGLEHASATATIRGSPLGENGHEDRMEQSRRRKANGGRTRAREGLVVCH